MTNYKYITSDPKILGGKSIVKGTRLSVEIIMEWLSTGGTVKTIAEKYPQLSEGAIKEAIDYASGYNK